MVLSQHLRVRSGLGQVSVLVTMQAQDQAQSLSKPPDGCCVKPWSAHHAIDHVAMHTGSHHADIKEDAYRVASCCHDILNSCCGMNGMPAAIPCQHQ